MIEAPAVLNAHRQMSTAAATVCAGMIGSRSGTIMAAASVIRITITGRGGHAAMPHLARDPVVASSAIVLALQSLISRYT